MAFTNPITGVPITPRLTVPSEFDSSLSTSDQILLLAHLLYKYFTEWDGDVAELKRALADEVATRAAGDEKLQKELNAQVDRLEQLIESGLDFGLLYQVYSGEYGDNQDTMRDTVNFVSVHALLVEEITAYCPTVDSLTNCGLNCHGLAVWSEWLQNKNIPIHERFRSDV